jgi:hypothetical protein
MTDELHAYLAMLAGPAPAGKLLELRHRTPGGMGQTFIPARRADRAASAIVRLGCETDVYVGVLLRTRRQGCRDAVRESHLLFVEIDQPDAQARLGRFAPAPSATLASGSTGHRHAYWVLERPVGADELVAANRRLAYALGADLASTDPARLLRPPSTTSFKREPPVPVRLLELDPGRRYAIDELVDGLTDPPTPAAVRRSRGTRGSVDPVQAQLLTIPTVEYVRRLTGREPNRAGKVTCPFHHPDRTPSLHLYDDGSWYCFSCAKGGSVFDFAASLWSAGTRGPEFLALRDRLRMELL